MNKILFNGIISDDQPIINMEDRGYQFGDGIYEVVGVYHSKLYLLDEHMNRLVQSAEKLNIELPFSIEEMKTQLLELVHLNKLSEGIVYLQVSRGVAPRTHELPTTPITPVVLAYTKTLDDLTELQDNGSTAILQEDIRWLRCDIKSLNLLPNTMAKQKAVEHSAVEAILHRGNIVTEASSSNVCIVKDGEIFTHPANNYILNGITRQRAIELCKHLDIPVHEKAFTVEQLFEADEVFITATKLDVVAINEIDGHTIGTGKPGAISRQLLKAFREDTKNI